MKKTLLANMQNTGNCYAFFTDLMDRGSEDDIEVMAEILFRFQGGSTIREAIPDALKSIDEEDRALLGRVEASSKEAAKGQPEEPVNTAEPSWRLSAFDEAGRETFGQSMDEDDFQKLRVALQAIEENTGTDTPFQRLVDELLRWRVLGSVSPGQVKLLAEEFQRDIRDSVRAANLIMRDYPKLFQGKEEGADAG